MALQSAECLYLSPPLYDAVAIAERVESLIHSGIEFPPPHDCNEPSLFFHGNYPIQYQDGEVPAQTAIFATEHPHDPTSYTSVVQQSWTCHDARERIEQCVTSRLVTEMMAYQLEPSDRLKLFHGVLQAFVELTCPHAIVFTHSNQVIDPDDYLASCHENPLYRVGSLNVRFFRITNSETDDMIMDTRGLDDIGLHDLQCHFHTLEPNAVRRILYNTAIYIAENGPVIESGHTIAGTTPESRWQCQFEDSLLEPKREVLDLNPGAPYAAGNR